MPVYVSYRYGKMRLDSAVLTKAGKIELRRGDANVSIPKPPALTAGERRLGNIWVTASAKKLDDSMLFPVLEDKYPEALKTSPAPAEHLLPKTMAELKSGGKLRVLAWGDSVTDAGYLPDSNNTRWQAQFVQRLRERYPRAEIVLMTEAWGGRNTGSYFNEPPGSIHNYKEKVLDLKPDLIISEFVNDAGLNEKLVYERYGRIRDDFRAIGAEWIILTPHYVRPDWMGLETQKGIDDDPRAYVKAVRKFAAENNIAVAEGSLRYGRLWRQGIPYLTLMMNNINHPDPYGMSLFADAIMELFP
jgi:lysophospholipase L1-like esterase